jgi:hypothetical protein
LRKGWDVWPSIRAEILRYAEKASAFILELLPLYSRKLIFYNGDYAWLPCVELKFPPGEADGYSDPPEQITCPANSLKLLSKCYYALRQFLNVASYSAQCGLEYV